MDQIGFACREVFFGWSRPRYKVKFLSFLNRKLKGVTPPPIIREIDPEIQWPVRAVASDDPTCFVEAADPVELCSYVEFWNSSMLDGDDWDITDAAGRRLDGKIELLDLIWLGFAKD